MVNVDEKSIFTSSDPQPWHFNPVSLRWNAAAKRHQQESNLIFAISYDILPGRCIWHIFWHSFWHSIWYILGDSLQLKSRGEHSALGAVKVTGELHSGACGGGPVGNILIQRLLFGSGVAHCVLELAIEVRQGSLWSRGRCSGPVAHTVYSRDCDWGPARITLIQRLLFGSGGAHCVLELAIEVWQGSLWSRGCCSGPVGHTAF